MTMILLQEKATPMSCLMLLLSQREQTVLKMDSIDTVIQTFISLNKDFSSSDLAFSISNCLFDTNSRK